MYGKAQARNHGGHLDCHPLPLLVCTHGSFLPISLGHFSSESLRLAFDHILAFPPKLRTFLCIRLSVFRIEFVVDRHLFSLQVLLQERHGRSRLSRLLSQTGLREQKNMRVHASGQKPSHLCCVIAITSSNVSPTALRRTERDKEHAYMSFRSEISDLCNCIRAHENRQRLYEMGRGRNDVYAPLQNHLICECKCVHAHVVPHRQQ